MDKPSAKVICHSKAPNGEELITLEIELHRFVLPEFNTHRVFSRNFQSSRAVPVEKMIEQVRTNPAMPVHWGKNQRGMQAEEEVPNYKDFGQGEYQWLGSASDAALRAEILHRQGYHKQIVNRLLEPFMWTKGVVTATREGFESFFKLRCHKDAQPEIKLLAERMKKAIDQSSPRKLCYGEYHLPYVDFDDPFYTLQEAIKVSTSCCAQVSYRVLDDSLEKALKIYGMLNLPLRGIYQKDPPHFSPTEHVAKVVNDKDWYDYTAGGNFVTETFWQYRKALELGNEKQFMGEQ
ncbi:MAG: putative thymidylate synthase [Prokaryotic dsDNA virus sp.]|nr:MAG: putative thymidylate synthase [Prokaryotic dsDNA virus sp.]|tara:strand:- start:2643 stop:3518 length:876 start_codon:yes stop_codon:yes gene_type:complete